MTPFGITVVLTVLAAVVVVLTRVRLAREGHGAGRVAIPPQLLTVHTGAGVPALLAWAAYLVTGIGYLGWAGLVLWWVTALAGLLVLARWLPARGRHAAGTRADSWGEGPGLSVLAHVGLLVGVVIFTVFLALGRL